jgi:hypothetical protein
MALLITPEIICGNVLYASFIHIPWRNLSRSNEVSEPLRGIGIVLVVICGQDRSYLFRLPKTTERAKDNSHSRHKRRSAVENGNTFAWATPILTTVPVN